MHSHDLRTLVHRGPVRVEACSCGAVHLHVGPFTLRMETEGFLSLVDSLVMARQQMIASVVAGHRPMTGTDEVVA